MPWTVDLAADVEGAVRQLGDGLLVSNVHRQQGGACASGQLAAGLLEVLAALIGEHELGPLVGKRLGESLPDAVPSPGDDDHLVVQILHVEPSRTAKCWSPSSMKMSVYSQRPSPRWKAVTAMNQARAMRVGRAAGRPCLHRTCGGHKALRCMVGIRGLSGRPRRGA
jgi:hypothetical protein